jgi:hypothetical protein
MIMDEMPGVPSPSWLGAIKNGYRWVCNRMRANIEFMATQQSVSAFKSPDTSISIWNVAVRVRASLFHSDVPDASIEVRIADFHEAKWGPVHHLRWFSKDHEIGHASMTLRAGSIYRIPVAKRKEGTAVTAPIGDAVLLSESIYSIGKKVDLKPGRYMMRLAVHSDENTWSSELYFLSVPRDGATNGLFYLQRKYSDQRPTREWKSALRWPFSYWGKDAGAHQRLGRRKR